MDDDLKQGELPGMEAAVEERLGCDLERLASSGGGEFSRKLYEFLIGMHTRDARTTVTVNRDYADIIKLIGKMRGVSFSEALGFVIAKACENAAGTATGAMREIDSSIADILEALDGIEAQLDGATDAVLVNAYGNFAASGRVSDETGKVLAERLAGLDMPKGADDGEV